MQTFAPYSSIKKSAESLDRSRLVVLRSESRIPLSVLEEKKSGRHLTKKMSWANRPVLKTEKRKCYDEEDDLWREILDDIFNPPRDD